MANNTTARLIRGILLLSTSTLAALSFAPQSTGKYVSADRSFELTVPPGYSVQTGKDKGSHSYIPVCHPESTVCITFPPGRYKGTTFEDASIEITILPAKTRQACLDPGKYEVSTSPDAEFQIDSKNPGMMIDGARFIHSFSAGAASSHDVVSDAYRGYKNGKCFELALQVTFANFRAYPAGEIKEFTKQDQKEVISELMRILDSFRSLP